jgi:Beta-propeller repeat
MKHIFTFFVLLFCINYTIAQVGINANGSAPATSAMLDVSSTSKGFLPPRMNTTQRTTITSPTAGLVVFDTDKNQLFVYSNSTWNAIAAPIYPRLSTEDIDALVSPQVGDLAYDLTFKCLKQYNGTKWLCTNQDADNIKPTMTAWKAGGSFIDIGYAITMDGAGNTYIVGIFNEMANFGGISITSAGNYDVFIAKYNKSGVIQWVRKVGGNSTDYGTSINLDSFGNVFVCGHFSNTATFGTTNLTSSGLQDIFITKYDNNGNFQWAQKAGGTGDDFAASIAVDYSGNSYITGSFMATAIFGSNSITSAGGTDVYIAKCNNIGSFQWVQKAGGSSDDSGTSVTLDFLGNNISITGVFLGTITFGVSNNLISAGLNDIFIAQFNNGGNLQWTQKAGGTGNDLSRAIGVDNSGNTYITGSFTGTSIFGGLMVASGGFSDVFIAKTDNTGSFQWVRKAGGAENSESGSSLSIDLVGNVYITGNFDGIATFGNVTILGVFDIFVAKYNSSGIFQWVQKAGGTNLDSSNGIVANVNGDIFITGFFNEKATFGSTTLTTTITNSSDIFIARLKE